MAKGIPEGKKRHMLTLTTERVDKFNEYIKKAGLPSSTLSGAVDDFLRDILPMLEKAASAGRLTIKDMFEMLGEQAELLLQEEKADAKKRKKAAQARK